MAPGKKCTLYIIMLTTILRMETGSSCILVTSLALLSLFSSSEVLLRKVREVRELREVREEFDSKLIGLN